MNICAVGCFEQEEEKARGILRCSTAGVAAARPIRSGSEGRLAHGHYSEASLLFAPLDRTILQLYKDMKTNGHWFVATDSYKLWQRPLPWDTLGAGAGGR